MIICTSFILIIVLWRASFIVFFVCLKYVISEILNKRNDLFFYGFSYLASQYCWSLSGDAGGKNCCAFTPNIPPATKTFLVRNFQKKSRLSCEKMLREKQVLKSEFILSPGLTACCQNFVEATKPPFCKYGQELP